MNAKFAYATIVHKPIIKFNIKYIVGIKPNRIYAYVMVHVVSKYGKMGTFLILIFIYTILVVF